MFEYMNMAWSPEDISWLEAYVGDWGFAISIVILVLELMRQAYKRILTWNIIGDAVANFVTLIGFLGIGLLFFGLYIGGFYWIHENFSLAHVPITGWSILVCLILADLAYYWEHRFMHRCGIGWATHTVHHSSPYFNISVAYRFGPLDGIMPFFFHAPLVMLGFDPLLVFACEAFVQLFQTLLHTEVVKKFPRPIEAIFNTPAHHRVHHGSNPEYIDKNYAGILIIWDRMFGTFEPEVAKVNYGLTKPIESINPWTIFFHGIQRLFVDIWKTKGLLNKVGVIVQPPGWEPAYKREVNQ